MMTRKKKRWSPYEERVLRRHVKKHPENLHYCFFLASKELDRTPRAIACHYYSVIRNNSKSRLFTLFSKFKNLFNVKNVVHKYGDK